MNFEGKVVVVTGAAQGIGRQIALDFASQKARLVILDVNPEALALAQKEISSQAECSYYSVDVTAAQQVEEVINKIIDKFSKIDIVVNNAGITRDNLILRLSENDWDKVISVNLKGAFLCSKLAAKFMLKQRQGKIINVSSIIGIVGNAGQANYSASKAGLIGLTKSLAKELGSRNICVNAVAPGYIQTQMTDKLPDKIKEEMLKRIPLNRLGAPVDVSNAVLFLASEAADYITGQVVVVDGGMI
ncbi:MAG: 3-oxoacyl-[acyl-carrier-protein] reductase [Candidatus Omnitrophica bacterium]|nr:3-oxoacyl-[acyl-carrier-protein] reductase [Candidatus Omnitrophota bacterium]MBU2251320.1 3-oxoacyl-[acyl-carrier-protein] reductase [Candidatus Omnitrophota bacterium]MBU2473997.1 3-oxoacyl-[acyl-carrier-protein] reductase [Candidatus Omnitrophota bacterium]